MGSKCRNTLTEKAEKGMGKLKEGTATEREKERDEYIRYNVDYKQVSGSYKEKDRITGMNTEFGIIGY
jgi:hypothetical protein